MAKRKSTKGKTTIYETYIYSQRSSNTSATKDRSELGCSRRVRRSCSTSDTRRVNLVTNQIIFRVIAGVHNIVFRYLYLVKRKEALSFNFTLRYTDDVLLLNNCVDRIYPIEPEIKDTTYTDRSASYLDLHLEIDSEERLRTKLYDKRVDFNFPIVNFPFMRTRRVRRSCSTSGTRRVNLVTNQIISRE
jgi:hypothetical protein